MSNLETTPEPDSPRRTQRGCLLAILLMLGIAGAGAAGLLVLYHYNTRPVSAVESILNEVRKESQPGGFASLLRNLFGGGSFSSGGNNAASRLAKMGPEAVPPLIAALQDSNANVRTVAADALGEIGDRRATAPLVSVLAKDGVETARERAATALGRLKDPASVEPLCLALKDAASSVRCNAASALGELRDPRATPALVEALKDSDARVRTFAADALGQGEDRRAVHPLMAALEDADSAVRAKAAWALGGLGDPEAKPALRERLKETTGEVGTTAARALGNLQDVEAVPALVELLRANDKSMRQAAASALGAIGDPAAAGPLTEALKDQANDVRSAAASALDDLGDPASIPALIALLGDPDGNVRGAAIKALGGFADERALAAILPLVDGNEKDLAYVAESLARTGNPAVSDALVRLVDKADPKENGRFWAAAGLGGLGDQRTVPALLTLLKDPDEGTQTVAAFALSLMKQPEAVPVLAKCLGEKAAWRGMAAVVGLVRIGTPEAKAALQQGAKACPNAAIQRFAARAQEAPLIEALGEVVRSNDADLALYGVRILPFLKDPAAAPILAEARKHRKASVREAAREAERYLKRLTAPTVK